MCEQSLEEEQDFICREVSSSSCVVHAYICSIGTFSSCLKVLCFVLLLYTAGTLEFLKN